MQDSGVPGPVDAAVVVVGLRKQGARLLKQRSTAGGADRGATEPTESLVLFARQDQDSSGIIGGWLRGGRVDRHELADADDVFAGEIEV